MEFDLDRVPSWARNWCYVFAFMGFMAIITGVIGIFSSGALGGRLTIAYLVAAIIQAATAFTLFWMCRTSLH